MLKYRIEELGITMAARKTYPSFAIIDAANRITVTAGTMLVNGMGNGKQSKKPYMRMQNRRSRLIAK